MQLKILFVAAEMSAQARALAKLAATVSEEGLKNSLTGVVSTITDLSSSLAGLETLLTGRRVQRATISNHYKYLFRVILYFILGCVSLQNIIAKYETIETQIQSVNDKIQTIFESYLSLSTDYPIHIQHNH